MPYYRFGKNDLFTNALTTYPEVNFYIYGEKKYLQNQDRSKINFNNPSGYANLYELNVNRSAADLIVPIMPKDATLTTFKAITVDSFATADYGTMFTGSYPMTASITTIIHTASLPPFPSDSRRFVEALKNTLNYNIMYSPHYAYSSNLGDKRRQELTFIDIPSIIYGSGIKKGSVTLDFFVSGSSLGKLVDKNQNGELIQISGDIAANDENVAGVVLYQEGIIILTGSWDLSTTHTAPYRFDGAAATAPKWSTFGRLTNQTQFSSYQVNFSGSQETSILTMMARAPAGELNVSHNPTFITYDTACSGNCTLATVVPTSFGETIDKYIKNTVSSSFLCHSESFNRQTFITKIGIYDEEKNLIAIANMARPVKKTEERDLTFKLKLDI